MPSGAKRRKAAAKKKKGQQEPTTENSNDSSSTNGIPSGNNDGKSLDERESDGGEVNSIASTEHHDQPLPFKEEGEELDKREPLPLQSFDSENKSMEEVPGDVEHAEKLDIEDAERELKSKEDSKSQFIDIKLKESIDGSSSSSSGSDDESQVVGKKTKDATHGSVSEAMSRNGENKPVESLAEEVVQVTEEASYEEADKSVVDEVTAVDSVKPLVAVTEEVISVAQSDLIENSLVPDIVETRLKETEESRRSEDKAFPLSEDNIGAPSSVVESISNRDSGKVLPASDAQIAETSNGAENMRDSKICKSSENQPLIASAPRPASRTSWMSCCGLLDVLTGSTR